MTTLTAGVGSPGTISIAGGQFILEFNAMNTTPLQVLGFAPQRQKIIFHNPGTIDIFVAPVYIQNSGSDAALTPSPSALGGCFRVYANGGTLEITGECQKPWQAFSASASGNPLTVMTSAI
jgi:hypothetical protein